MSGYLEAVCPKLGLAYPGEAGFTHNVGTFRFIDLPLEGLTLAVALRRKKANKILGEEFIRIKKKYHNQVPSKTKEDEELRWRWNVRHYFPLKFSEYEYVVRSHKGGKFGNDTDMSQEYAGLRDALARKYLANYLYSAGNFPPTFEGWKRYLERLDPSFVRFLKESHPVLIKESSRAVHTYICGTTGSGKSSYLELVCHGYIKNPNYCSLVVLEPSARLVTRLAQLKENLHNDRLIYFTYDPALGKCPVINPLEIYGVDPSDTSPQAIGRKQVMASELVDALGEVIRADGDTQFTINMKATLEHCVMALLDKEGATLRDLLRLMEDNQNDDLVNFAKTRTHYPDTVAFFKEKFKPSSRDKSGGSINQTKNALYMKLTSLFSTGVFAHVTCGKSTIQLEKAVNERKIIIFNLSKGKMAQAPSSAFGRLIVAMLRGIAARRDDMHERDIVPIHLVLDEFQNYCSASIRTVMEEQRKFKLILTLCQTEIGMGMSAALEKAVLNGTSLKIAGAAEQEQRKRVANLFPVDEAQILSLRQGDFITRTERHTPAFRVTTHKHLIENSDHFMTEAEWQQTLQRQYALYYRPVQAKAEATVHTLRPALITVHQEDEQADETAAAEWKRDI